MHRIFLVLGSVSIGCVALVSKTVRVDPDDLTLDVLTDWIEPVVPVETSPTRVPRTRIRQERGEVYWLFGTHHKTGTHLARWLARYQSEALGNPLGEWWPQGYCSKSDHDPGQSRLWVLCHISGQEVKEISRTVARARGRLRMVHFIREPISLVVSSYLYHSRQTEDWGPDHPRINYSELSMEAGLEYEAEWALSTEVLDMVNASTAREDDALFLRLEDFTHSSASFNATVERLYTYTLGGLHQLGLIRELIVTAAMQDLHREAPARRENQGHVAAAELTQRAKEVVGRIPPRLLERLRRAGEALGYKY